MTPKLLSERQKKFLNTFGQSKLSSNFYLTGGTALVSYYIPYRYSEDLDFFSQKEVDIQAILTFFKSQKETLGYKKLEFNTSFNRNLFFLRYKGEELKIEFTYFPFPQIESPKKEIILVDSLIDIAVNKLFTIYQNPRCRDFTDLYMIHKRYSLEFSHLIKKAKLKFDWHIDPLKLGSQLMLVKKLKDYPRFIKPIESKKWQDYFLKEARELGKSIFS